MQLAILVDPGQADQRRRAAVGSVARQLLAGRSAGLLERGLQHQILGRIAGEVEFGRKQEVGAESGGLLARLAQPVPVAGDVTDNRGDLGERNDEAVRGGRHGVDLARGLEDAQCVSAPRPRSSPGQG